MRTCAMPVMGGRVGCSCATRAAARNRPSGHARKNAVRFIYVSGDFDMELVIVVTRRQLHSESEVPAILSAIEIFQQLRCFMAPLSFLQPDFECQSFAGGQQDSLNHAVSSEVPILKSRLRDRH